VNDLARSALDWWDEAGVDVLVEETPRDWLAPVRTGAGGRAADARAPISVDTKAAAPWPSAPQGIDQDALPGDLAAFRTWLLADSALPGRLAARLDASGDPASGTMVLLDMPEREDIAARRLLSGEIGDLFDRMLAAMGLTRDTIYLAPFSPARPPSGQLDVQAAHPLGIVQRHHLGLVRPRRLLLMGAAPTRALLGQDTSAARGRISACEIGGAALPTVATFAPRFITQAVTPEDRKARRATIWADLQVFMGL
jgi:DNA polymerase